MSAIQPTRHRMLWSAFLAGLLLAGCGGGGFHDHWRAGRYEAAARAFRADSALRSDARALYRMAVLQLSPGLPLHDRSAARSNLEAALALDPEPEVRREAAVLLELTGQVIRLRDQLEALKSIDLQRAPDDTTSTR